MTPRYKSLWSITILSVALVACTAAWSGCTKSTVTTQGPTGAPVSTTTYTVDQNALDLVAAGLKVSVKTTAVIIMQKNASTVQYFQAADVALSAALDSGSYDTKTLEGALNVVHIPGNNDTLIKSAIGDILDVYAATEGTAVSKGIDKVAWLASGLTAVQQGIHSALAIQNP
jgi:hypothetical protein